MSQTPGHRGRPRLKYGKFIASRTVLHLDCVDETLSPSQHKYFETKRKEYNRIQQQIRKLQSDPDKKVQIFDKRLKPEELSYHINEFEAFVQASIKKAALVSRSSKERAASVPAKSIVNVLKFYVVYVKRYVY